MSYSGINPEFCESFRRCYTEARKILHFKAYIWIQTAQQALEIDLLEKVFGVNRLDYLLGPRGRVDGPGFANAYSFSVYLSN